MEKREKLLQLISFLDLTSLESTDNETTITELVRKANEGYKGVHPAAVCVYPNYGNFVAQSVLKTIQTAVVGGAFPSGQTLTRAKISELETINTSTADEVDIVINRGEFLAGNYDYVSNELNAMRAAVPNKLLKIILETGELNTSEAIQKASELAIDAGADFIKTSTGKCAVGATPEAAEIMCDVIAKHAQRTDKKIGFKPSGGIRTIESALAYYDIVEKKLGTTWLQPALFRIGASSLYAAIVNELKNGDKA